MILVADSSALIALAVIDKLELLDDIFKEVYIPRAVFNEICNKNKSQSEKLTAYCNDKVLDINSNINLNITLGLGESEAIMLYKEKNADYLLCDDKKAKKFAKSFGVNAIGSLGILLKAKEKGLITELKPLIETLKSSQIYIDEKTCEFVLRMAGEAK